MSKTLTINEITSKIGSGATPKGGKQTYLGGTYALIRSQNVYDFIFSYDGLAYINEEQAKKLDNVEVHKNDVLLNITGDSIARCCIVPDNILPARVNQHVSIIRCKNIKDSKYLQYYLINLKPYLMNICGVGGTRNALTKEAIGNLPIKFQENHIEIANVLSSLDKKIELNNKINKKLEVMAKTLYDYWFVQFDFPDSNGKPYKSSDGKMVYNKELKREIPEGWEVVFLDNILEFEKGIEPGSSNYKDTKISSNYIPFIKVADMNGEAKTFIDQNIALSAVVQEDDILVSFDGTVGKVAIGLKGSYSSGIRKIYQKDKFFPKSFIYEVFKSNEIQQTIKKYATGSNILHAGSSIKNLKIPYSKNIVKKFDLFANKIFKKIILNIQENQKLSNLRDWLLPMLMNRQVKLK